MDPTVDWSPNPKSVPQGAREFTANGKVYRKADSVSAQRWLWLTKLQVEFGYGKTVAGFYANQKEAFELLNKSKPAEAAVCIHNSMQGVANIGNERAPAAVRIAAQFWNSKDEDTSIMTEELIEEKWQDWMHEGIDIVFFFEQASSAVVDLLNGLVGQKKVSSNERQDGQVEVAGPSTATNE